MLPDYMSTGSATSADVRWIRAGGLAGLLYVVVALVAAALPGAPPPADGRAITFQNYFIAHQESLVVQAWMYALAAPLMLMFAAAVRKVLQTASAAGYLSELFLIGTTAVAALLVVAMSMQIAFAQFADRLETNLVYALGAHFGTVLVGLSGFIVALTAFAYAFCVFRFDVAPRWTGYLAVVALAVNLAGTVGVFVRTGAFSMEGGFSAWAPAASLTLWYLGTSIALVRRPSVR
jgi:hypothetical protein